MAQLARQAESVALAPSQSKFNPILVSELTRRGISEKKAHELLANLKPGQEKELVRQLEHAEHLVKESQIPITNPAGFIIRLIEYNTPVPDGFETNAQRTAREERERRERARRAAEEAQQQVEQAYDDYRETEIDRYIAANNVAFEALKDTKWKEDRERFAFTTESMARMSARFEMQKQLTFLTLEEFLQRKKQGTDLFLKSVGPSPAAESAAVEPNAQHGAVEIEIKNIPSVGLAPDTQVARVTESLFSQEEAIAPVDPPEDLLAADEIREADIQKPAAEEAGQTAPVQSTPEPALPEPIMIELVSDPPPGELGGASAEQGIA